MKVLILRFSSIGDIVLTTPVVRCLKTQLPNAEIHYATKQSFKIILESNPFVDKIHCLDDNGIFNLIKILRSENFDAVIDLHNNQRTFLIKSLLMVKSYSFPKLNFRKWLLTTFKINVLPDIHIVDRYFKAVEKLSVVNDGKGLDYFIDKKDDLEPKLLDGRLSQGYIAFAIGAKFSTKQMPLEKMLAICSEINRPIALLGGKEDFERGEKLALLLPEKSIVNLCGKLSLGQSASVVKQSFVVLTHDTGLMHIAAAFHKNIVSVWGNTVPQLGMYAYVEKQKSKIIQVENLSCRPCSKIGHSKCPKHHFKCMVNIDENEVVSAINSFS